MSNGIEGRPTGRKKIRTDRLLKLADFLETVPRKAFDISSWVSSKATMPEGERPGDCGFAGCAMGWAAHAKLFRGLTMERGYIIDYPAYRGFDGFEAAMTLFSIGDSEATSLFDIGGYESRNPTPKTVAKRIRKFVAEAR
jgi:hypothetical protein